MRQAEQEAEIQRYELFGEIDKNAVDEETERWLEKLVEDKDYFEKVVEATLYYKLFVGSDEEKASFFNGNSKKDEDIYKILEPDCNTGSFSVQGVSKAHGNDVGKKFKNYVTNKLESSYKYVMEKEPEAINKFLIFRNTKAKYAQKMECLEVYLVKKYAYKKLEDWLDDIEDRHWFSQRCLWGILSFLDKEGEWAKNASRKMKEAKNGANANYGNYYEDTASFINNLKLAEDNAAQARKKYNKTITGSENGTGEKLKGSEVKKKIQALLSENVKMSVDLAAVLIIFKIRLSQPFDSDSVFP